MIFFDADRCSGDEKSGIFLVIVVGVGIVGFVVVLLFFFAVAAYYGCVVFCGVEAGVVGYVDGVFVDDVDWMIIVNDGGGVVGLVFDDGDVADDGWFLVRHGIFVCLPGPGWYSVD